MSNTTTDSLRAAQLRRRYARASGEDAGPGARVALFVLVMGCLMWLLGSFPDLSPTLRVVLSLIVLGLALPLAPVGQVGVWCRFVSSLLFLTGGTVLCVDMVTHQEWYSSVLRDFASGVSRRRGGLVPTDARWAATVLVLLIIAQAVHMLRVFAPFADDSPLRGAPPAETP